MMMTPVVQRVSTASENEVLFTASPGEKRGVEYVPRADRILRAYNSMRFRVLSSDRVSRVLGLVHVSKGTFRYWLGKKLRAHTAATLAAVQRFPRTSLVPEGPSLIPTPAFDIGEPDDHERMGVGEEEGRGIEAGHPAYHTFEYPDIIA
jgi:hypothetical protein